jgi:hypothetical protein
VFVTWSIETLRPTYPLSILAHQLRRRFRSNSSLLRGARPIYSTTWPESSLVVRSVRPAHETSSPRTRNSRQNRLTFRGPSWDNLYRVPLCSPSSSPPKRLEVGSRVARQEDYLFRRLFPAGPDKNPKALPIACRRRSDLWSPAAPSCRCRLLGRPGPPSRSPMHHAPLIRVAEAKNAGLSLWIMGISGTTIGTFAEPRPGTSIRLPFRSPCLTSPRCLNRQFRRPSPLTCRA